MNLPEALEWLGAHVNLETGIGVPSGADRRKHAPTLARIRALTDLLGSPHESFPAVHLTGTNGKTSATRMTAALLDAVGLSTGAFTSPNLERVQERMAWRGEPIGDEALAEVLTRVAAVEEFLPDRPSFFEILTAAAFDWFADVAVDVAIVEVGLGGTWDSTNILHAPVAVVTNVSVDHVEYLGETRGEIAREKAGIVQMGATLVLGETDPELRGCFEERKPAQILLRDRDFAVQSQRLAHGGRVLDVVTPGRKYEDLFLPLHGAHQADNAVIALTAAEAFLGEAIPDHLVAEAFSGLQSPGRLEVVGHQPLVLLDGAHNVAGAHALLRALNEEFVTGPRTLVVGLLREKEPHEMLDALGIEVATRLVCTRAPSPRALDPGLVATAAEDLGLDHEQIDVVDTIPAAIARAREITPPDGQIVVTGSLYTVGAARSVLIPHA